LGLPRLAHVGGVVVPMLANPLPDDAADMGKAWQAQCSGLGGDDEPVSRGFDHADTRGLGPLDQAIADEELERL
jgi:hypothetical protein